MFDFIGQPLFIWIFILAFLLRKLFFAVLLAALSAIGEASLKMIQEALLTSRRATAKVLDGAVLVSQVVQMGATAAFCEHFGGFAGCFVLGLSYQDSKNWNVGPDEHEGEYCLDRASWGYESLFYVSAKKKESNQASNVNPRPRTPQNTLNPMIPMSYSYITIQISKLSRRLPCLQKTSLQGP